MDEESSLVTVYIPCHNYGRFLPKAIESVIDQSHQNWELLIFDDGSDDDTSRIADMYSDSHEDKIKTFRHEEAQGLQACANRAIEEARGRYIMRLDADDWLDENALLVMASYLDGHPDVVLVFPNYIYVDRNGEFLAIEHRRKIPDEIKMMDLPAHGACTMIRRSTLRTVGGYNEEYDRQDGYELWLKTVPRYRVANVSTPLFFYRQHGDSLSRDMDQLLETRRTIKNDVASDLSSTEDLTVTAIVPVKNTYQDIPNIALREMAGKPLIDWTLEDALAVDPIDSIYVTTDDPDVVSHCDDFPGVRAELRPEELSHGHNLHDVIIQKAVEKLEEEHGTYPDVIVDLSIHSPLREPDHIQEAIDTLVLYDADSVVSVCEDRRIHFTHGEHGLETLNRNMRKRLKLEREALYVDNLAVKTYWRETLHHGDILGKNVSHIVMSETDRFNIQSEFDAWIVSKILQDRYNEDGKEKGTTPAMEETV